MKPNYKRIAQLEVEIWGAVFTKEAKGLEVPTFGARSQPRGVTWPMGSAMSGGDIDEILSEVI